MKTNPVLLGAMATILLLSCTGEVSDDVGSLNLPIAHSNNAVALARTDDGQVLFSFNGLRAGTSHANVSKQAFACQLNTHICEQIPDVPVDEGRLASSAITLNNQVYLFGGYTVGEDGSEVSTPEVFRFDPTDRSYTRLSDMPVPVDDAVIFTHQDRYIYLVSGWHNDGNVSDVQVYDTAEALWFEATDYPGSPVFGHAGGAVDSQIIIADGVAVVGVVDGRRQFGEVDEVWHGKISENDPSEITWTRKSPHPFGPLYRMAAIGSPNRNAILFAGGGDNPYNITGVGYDGVNAVPSDVVFAFDLETEAWTELGRLQDPSMDHRGLLEFDNRFYIIGGLTAELGVRSRVTVFTAQ